jgi:hypothetical protein
MNERSAARRPCEVELTLDTLERVLGPGGGAGAKAHELSPDAERQVAEIEQVARLLEAVYEDPALLGARAPAASSRSRRGGDSALAGLCAAMYGVGRLAGVASALVLLGLLMVSWLHFEPPIIDHGTHWRAEAVVVAGTAACPDASPMAGLPPP